jgi:hypothetical protein
MSDQEFDGGGRFNRGGNVQGAGAGMIPPATSRRLLRTTSAGLPARSAAKAEPCIDNAVAVPPALIAVETGSHGAEKSGEAPGIF